MEGGPCDQSTEILRVPVRAAGRAFAPPEAFWNCSCGQWVTFRVLNRRLLESALFQWVLTLVFTPPVTGRSPCLVSVQGCRVSFWVSSCGHGSAKARLLAPSRTWNKVHVWIYSCSMSQNSLYFLSVQTKSFAFPCTHPLCFGLSCFLHLECFFCSIVCLWDVSVAVSGNMSFSLLSQFSFAWVFNNSFIPLTWVDISPKKIHK